MGIRLNLSGSPQTLAQALCLHPPLQSLAQPLAQALVHHLVNACTGVQATPILRSARSSFSFVQVATNATLAQTLQLLHHLVNANPGVQETPILRSARSTFNFVQLATSATPAQSLSKPSSDPSQTP